MPVTPGVSAHSLGDSTPGSPDAERERSFWHGATHQSWGRFPYIPDAEQGVIRLEWRDSIPEALAAGGTLLPYGQGRSYGDSCLNRGGTLLDTSGLRRFIEFDQQTGLLRCECGVTLEDVLAFAVPRGWFLPTTPGTKFVSLGGAIANDVHGKNHHVAGTFGRHITRLGLVRSDGGVYECSPDEHRELFNATIGGLGLTGLITWAELQLRQIAGPYIEMETLKFRSLDEFFEISAESDRQFESTMSWVDCLATGQRLGRGLFMRGNHSWKPDLPGARDTSNRGARLPVDFPGGLLNRYSVRAFNTLYYHRQLSARARKTVHYEPFYYPLDSISDWNRMYGRNGFLQHQCVIPRGSGPEAIRSILETTSRSGEGSFLAVLKNFGDIESPGMLSFPRPGVTLALDFAYRGKSTLQLLDELDEIVIDHGGAIYPAKDARMSPDTFEASFPRWRDFAGFVDEKFSSSFWKRVTAGRV